jgi:NADPH:quinone reductase-like Zn-dependent oxidoreductase
LKELGATHVIDRQKVPRLVDEVTKITTEKIEFAYDAWSSAESQQAVYDTLAPGGKLVIVLANQINEAPEKDVTVVHVFANVHKPENRGLGARLYSKLGQLLQEEKIKVRVE